MRVSKGKLRYYFGRIFGERMLNKLSAIRTSFLYRRKTLQNYRKLLSGPHRPVPTKPSELWLFAIVRNETLRLPYWLEYYRKRGVDRFLIIDHESDDGTSDYLEAQPDVHRWSVQGNYTGYWRWMEALLERQAIRRWIMVVDVDELVDLPGNETFSGLVEKLKARGETAYNCLMLDRYPAGPLSAITVAPGEDPLPSVPFFDNKVRWQDGKLQSRRTGQLGSFTLAHGGVRERMFKSGPCLSKVPLLYYDRKTWLSTGMHWVFTKRMTTSLGIVWHTKFLQDYVKKIESETIRNQHWNDASDYRMAHQVMREDPDQVLYDPAHSVRFESYAQLKALGFYRPI